MRKAICTILSILMIFSVVPGDIVTSVEAETQPSLPPDYDVTTDPAPELSYKPGEIIIKLKPGYEMSDLGSLNAKFGVQSHRKVFSDTSTPTEKLQKLKKRLEGLESNDHSGWYWQMNPDSDEYKEYQKRIELEKEFVKRKIARQEAVVDRLSGTKISKDQKIPSLKNVLIVETDKSANVEAMVASYSTHPAVEYAQPNRRYIINALPNDTYADPDGDGQWSEGAWGQDYPDLWGLRMVKAIEAWNGEDCDNNCMGEGVTVAVIDTGLDRSHPDIQGNIYVNPGEDLDGNGIFEEWEANGDDDDDNGYDDDYSGINCAWLPLTNDPADGHGHGTHVSGTIAAVANNGIGMAGIAPKAKILPVKVFWDTGGAWAGSIVEGIRYAVDLMDADADGLVDSPLVINNSWGCADGCSDDPMFEDIVRYAYGKGAVILFSAGNSNTNIRKFNPNNLPEVIGVASVDHNGNRSSFSNYGALVELSAPGGESGSRNPATQSILSLRSGVTDMYGSYYTNQEMVVDEQYYRARGTSMSCPHAVGVAALLLGKRPDLSFEDVLGILQATTTPYSQEQDQYIGTGIINAEDALSADKSFVRLVSFERSLENQYVHAGETVEFTIRVAFKGLDAPLQATITTSHPGIQLLNDSASLNLVSGTHHFAENVSSPFTFRYNGGEPVLFGDVDFEISIAGYSNTIPVKLSFGAGNLPGWPIDVVASALYQAPALADLNGDGKQDVIISGLTKAIYAYDASGSAVPGWPTQGLNYSFARFSPIVTDWDNDGEEELLVVTGVYASGQEAGTKKTYINLWHQNGQVVEGWPKILPDAWVYASSPAVADMDATPDKEIIVGDEDLKKVYILKFDGTIVKEWQTGGKVLSSPVAVDLDGNGFRDVAAATDNGKLYIWKQTSIGQWTETIVSIGGYPKSSLAVADLDGQPGLEIVVSSTDRMLYAFDSEGAALPGWPVDLDTNFEQTVAVGGSPPTLPLVSSPSIADLDGDGILEIVVGVETGDLFVLHPDGSVAPGWPVRLGDKVRSSCAIDDLDGDGQLDIVVGSTDFNVYAFAADGTPIPGWPVKSSGSVETSPAIGDINGDGTKEVIFLTDESKLYAITMNMPSVTPTDKAMPWPTYRQNYKRTGTSDLGSGSGEMFGVPSHLRIKDMSDTRLTLAWDDTVIGDQGFIIERSADNISFSEISRVGRDQTQYQDTNLTFNSTYYYRVRAYAGTVVTEPSDVLVAATPSIKAPSGLTYTRLDGETMVHLNWTDNSDNETGFQIEYVHSYIPTFEVLATVGPDVTSYEFPYEGGVDYYRVVAVNGPSKSGYSNVISSRSAEGLLQRPYFTADPGAREVFFRSPPFFDWPVSNLIIERFDPAAGKFREIVRNPDPYGYTDENLTPNTEYTYRARTSGTFEGETIYSDYYEQTVRTLVALVTPTNLRPLDVKSKSITVSWDPTDANEVEYDIEAGPDGITFPHLAVVPAGQTSHTFQNLIPDTVYYFRVRARYSQGQTSPYSPLIPLRTRTAILPPTGLTSSLEGTSVRLNWTNQAPDADNIIVRRRTGLNLFYDALPALSSSVTTFLDTGTVRGETYRYYLVAERDEETSTSSALVVVTIPPPAAPTNAQVAHATSSTISLVWQDNSDDEEKFVISRSPYNLTGFEPIGEVGPNITTFEDTNLEANKRYYYRIQAQAGVGLSDYTTFEGRTLDPSVIAPTNLTATPVSSAHVRLDWQDNSGDETSFRVEVSTDGTYFTTYSSAAANATSLVVGARTYGPTYYFRVRAVRSGALSAYSPIASNQTLEPIVAATNVSAQALSSSSIHIQWQDNSAAESGFQLKRQDLSSGGSGTVIINLPADSTEFTDTGLTPNTQYTYTLFTLQYTLSKVSPTVDVTTLAPNVAPILSPIGSQSTNEGQPMSLTISATDANTSDSLVYTATPLPQGANFVMNFSFDPEVPTTYSLNWTPTYDQAGTYTIHFEVNDGRGGVDSEDVVITVNDVPQPPKAPISLNAISTGWTSNALSWTDASTNELGFKIERSALSFTGFTQIGQVGANITGFVDSNADSGKTYYYRVRAYNNVGNSAYTNVKSIKTSGAPTYLRAQVYSTISLGLQWNDNSSIEANFELQRSENASTFTTIATLPANTVEYTENNLVPGKTYYYRVRATNGSYVSNFSNMIQTSTYSSSPSPTPTPTPTPYPSGSPSPSPSPSSSPY